jgi:Ser/Thr protein kinase RdoA (MazF antagonist)
MNKQTANPAADFSRLTPDHVLGYAETALGRRLSSVCRPLNSYINRVFELQTEEREGVIAKFYRPGRWSHAALLDEHEFLLELAEREIPVVPPLLLENGKTLGEADGIFFALFPKRLGRACDEFQDEQWEEFGRLLARIHRVGAMHPPRDRITISPTESTQAHLSMILNSELLPQSFHREYQLAAEEIIAAATPLFKGAEAIRIHGDLHRGNIVHRPGESFYVIDFDDMAVGPVVQDFWMLLPDYSRASLLEIDLFIEGYETFRTFDRRTVRMIEALRGMRYIHFTAWLVAQARDANVARIAAGWGTTEYWRGEIRYLREQLQEISATKNPMGW